MYSKRLMYIEQFSREFSEMFDSNEIKKFDIVVAGAGVAGCCAAIAAARTGKNVLLIEQTSGPGGVAVHCGCPVFIGFGCYDKQIVGGLGIVGCLAYAFQGLIRLKLAFYRPNCKTTAVSLCYLGLFLYSQTDPGEFIPIPFAALAVLMFVLFERHYERDKDAKREKECKKEVC